MIRQGRHAQGRRFTLIGHRLRLACVAGALMMAALPAIAARTSAATTGRSVTVVNRTRQPIEELHITEVGDNGWGADRLTGSLAQGRSRTISLTPENGCRYDVKIVYRDDATEENMGVDLCRTRQLIFDGKGAVAALRSDSDITVKNRMSVDVLSIYIAPASRSDWGNEWLGKDVFLSPQETHEIAYRGTCDANIRVVFRNGSVEERHDYDVCRNNDLTIVSGWTTNDRPAAIDAATMVDRVMPPPSNGPRIQLSNQSGHDLTSLYLYPDESSEHGNDLLGSGTLDNHETKSVNFDRAGQCRFIMRASFSGMEDDIVRPALDLCTQSKLELTAAMLVNSTILNAGTQSIVTLYVDAPGNARGADRLGDGVIARGEKFSLSAPDIGVCLYQVTGIFRDGRVATVNGDLCKSKPVEIQ